MKFAEKGIPRPSDFRCQLWALNQNVPAANLLQLCWVSSSPVMTTLDDFFNCGCTNWVADDHYLGVSLYNSPNSSTRVNQVRNMLKPRSLAIFAAAGTENNLFAFCCETIPSGHLANYQLRFTNHFFDVLTWLAANLGTWSISNCQVLEVAPHRWS
jgi:hypothetical protein